MNTAQLCFLILLNLHLPVVVVQLLTHVPLFAAPQTSACSKTVFMNLHSTYRLPGDFVKMQILIQLLCDSNAAGPGTTLEIRSAQLSLVAQSCPTLCNPMNYSTPAFPVHHEIPELAQVHVHQICDAIQPSHPLSSPSPPTFYLS